MAHHVAVRGAWEEAFGDLDPERFESDFRKYLVRPETTLQATTYTRVGQARGAGSARCARCARAAGSVKGISRAPELMVLCFA